MKKLSVFLSIMIVIAALCGCSTTVEPTFDQNKPWRIFSALSSHCSESMTYEVEIFGGTVEDILLNDPTQSSYTVALNESTATVGEESTPVATVKTELKVVYRSDLDFADKGLTDTIATEVVFRLDSLSAISSYRKVTLADRADKPNDSYEVTCDYIAKTSAITYADGSTKSIKLKPSSPVYDNEMMYYIVRSSSNIKDGGSDTFRFTNGYENFLSGSYATHPFNQSTQGTLDIEVGKNIFDLVATDSDKYDKTDENGTKYFVTCHNTQITLSKTKQGPSFYSYMSRGAFIDGTGTTYKVPVALINYQYDLKGKTTRTQICTLTSYHSSGNYGA